MALKILNYNINKEIQMTNEEILEVWKKMEQMSDDEWEIFRQTKEFRTFFKQTMNELTEIKEGLQSTKDMVQPTKENNILND